MELQSKKKYLSANNITKKGVLSPSNKRGGGPTSREGQRKPQGDDAGGDKNFEGEVSTMSKQNGKEDSRSQSLNVIEIFKEQDPDSFKPEHLTGENGLFTIVKRIMKQLASIKDLGVTIDEEHNQSAQHNEQKWLNTVKYDLLEILKKIESNVNYLAEAREHLVRVQTHCQNQRQEKQLIEGQKILDFE